MNSLLNVQNRSVIFYFFDNSSTIFKIFLDIFNFCTWILKIQKFNDFNCYIRLSISSQSSFDFFSSGASAKILMIGSVLLPRNNTHASP